MDKIKQRLLVTLLVLTGYTFQVKAQSDTTKKYYYDLANSKSKSDHVLVIGKLYELLKDNNKEGDWIMAQNIFGYLKRKSTADSLEAIIKTKFPGGEYWMELEVNAVYDAKTAKEKEAAYKKWLAKYPVNKFEDDKISYDYASNAVATAYADEKNPKKAIQYANMVMTPVWRSEGWADVATRLEKNGYINEAIALYKKAIKNSYDFKTTRATEEGAGFAATGYPGYCSYYAGALFKQKKYDTALLYIQKAYAEEKEPAGYINQTYAEILKAMGRNKEAYSKADEIVKLGQADAKMKDMHKTLYLKLNPGGKPYEVYMKETQDEVTKNIIANLKNTIIDKPSPSFVLKDVNSDSVNSESLKGKIVILDFWATWCGPCKASFPAMQMAVNKYKDDPNIKFLFIHTWEREDEGDDAKAAAKKYIEDHKYSFRVLMDLKDAETGSNNVVESFGVNGIPSKFVIDQKGNIRFNITGFTGSDEAAVEELSAMIEMVQKL